VLVCASVVATSVFLDVIDNPDLGYFVAAGVAALSLAALTPYRQAVHDFVARSLVVNRKVFGTAVGAQCLRDAVIRGRIRRRPSWRLRPVEVLLQLAPLFMLAYIYIDIYRQRATRARVEYAYNETGDLRSDIKDFWLKHGEWPVDAAALGADERREYPDGGDYQLESAGRVRISFTVKPELTGGTVVLTPAFALAEPRYWKCHVDGFIKPLYCAPHMPTATPAR
jgi:hypothetical protein